MKFLLCNYRLNCVCVCVALWVVFVQAAEKKKKQHKKQKQGDVGQIQRTCRGGWTHSNPPPPPGPFFFPHPNFLLTCHTFMYTYSYNFAPIPVHQEVTHPFLLSYRLIKTTYKQISMATWALGHLCFLLIGCGRPEHQAASSRLKILNICWGDLRKCLAVLQLRASECLWCKGPAFYSLQLKQLAVMGLWWHCTHQRKCWSLRISLQLFMMGHKTDCKQFKGSQTTVFSSKYQAFFFFNLYDYLMAHIPANQNKMPCCIISIFFILLFLLC